MKCATTRRGRRPVGRHISGAVRPPPSPGPWFVITPYGATPVRARTPDAWSLAETAAASGWPRATLIGFHKLVMARLNGRITTAEIRAQVAEYERQRKEAGDG